ncbi:uncharacterized protein EI90DRAFT_3146228 [Cantharellus anzutake]|uniref:uncharacterized protein n=1 Tax=Cantharellus anzutake TaxID=1750568 RepID=UPI0019061571|nr:uncharacterized protein EI90DRAFT_3146228 [Cantharellus anzutake]KAF8328209.1 hypothetical protein EI90DRAFT_3146228 [Cantharellus anzutake]
MSRTLQQKLSSLSLSETYKNTRESISRRNIFSGLARRDNPGTNHTSAQPSLYSDNGAIDEVMQKVITQAGVDFEIVLTASQFPDPRQVSYDLLLSRMMLYLDLFVENDYTVVFLAAGGRYTPPWNWVWKAYRSLNKKYRKNLKKLYIVHTTIFTKMLFSLAGAIISPKFFRKIYYVQTLSALAEYVPLTNLDLPPAAYQENLKYENEITLPTMQKEHSKAFGVSLDDLMGDYGISSGIPRVVRDCVDYVRMNGLESEGIFRRSPSSALLKQIKEAYNRGQTVSLSSFGDPHIAAVLLKAFFRDLPQPHLLPLIERRSPATLTVLSEVLHLLHEISLRSSTNRMDAFNLATTFSPNLLSGSNVIQDMQMCSIPGASAFSFPSSKPTLVSEGDAKSSTLGMVIRICIDHYFDIFEEHADRSVANAMRPAISESSELNDRFINSPLTPPTSRSSASPSNRRSAANDDDDEDPDEAILVMPLGPSPPISPTRIPTTMHSPPGQVQRRDHAALDIGNPNASPPRAERSLSKSPASAIRGTVRIPTARSMISIEGSPDGRRGSGSIVIGRGARKISGAGAGVEAYGITAAGSFAPPAGAEF